MSTNKDSDSTNLSRYDVLAIVTAAQEKIGCRQEYDGSGEVEDGPRFILFHAPFSTCSEKSRSVMFATGFQWISRSVNLQQPYDANYSPEYVKLRKVAWEQLSPKPPLLGDEQKWDGTNSATNLGLDLTAVPTLVDLKPDTPKVIVDSMVICQYLADASAESTSTDINSNLNPPEVKDVIDRHMTLVDNIPQTALISGGGIPLIADERPSYLQKASKAGILMQGRITSVQSRIEEYEQLQEIQKVVNDNTPNWEQPIDPIMLQAYKAKLNALMAQQNWSMFSSDDEKEKNGLDPSSVVSKLDKVLTALAADLSKSETGWICNSTDPTMIDYVYGATLYRLIWLGMKDYVCEKYPPLASFVDRVYDLKTLEQALIKFPGSPPSKSTSFLIEKYQGPIPAFLHNRKADVLMGAISLKLACHHSSCHDGQN